MVKTYSNADKRYRTLVLRLGALGYARDVVRQLARGRHGDARNAADHLEGILTGESRVDRKDAGTGRVDEREPATTTTVAVRRPHEDDSDRDEVQIYFTFEKQITG